MLFTFMNLKFRLNNDSNNYYCDVDSYIPYQLNLYIA